ncbi:MAG: hypothetical protein JW944_13775 [Deltaproteobacteria bacterium]|nr:hypothetical protein [Deltaproteobacteria bacterium]
MSIYISDINNAGHSFRINAQDQKINLKNGEIIRGTVIRNLPDGGLLLSVKGKELSMPEGTDLPVGSKHLFQVNITESRIELKLLEAPLAKAGQPPAMLSAGAARETLTNILTELKGAMDQAGLSRTTAQAVQNLRQLIPLLVYAGAGDKGGIWVKESITAGGLLWESKVAEFLLSDEKDSPIKKLLKGDLKGILLSLQKGLLDEGKEENDTLAVKIRQALNLIEGNQQLNLSTLEEGLGWMFFIPGFEKDGFLGAEIFSKKRDEKGGIFFTVLLEFTRLGRFQANVSMIESGMFVKIIMDDENKAKIVNDNLHFLEKGLSALDIKNVKVSCDVRKGEETIEDIVPNLRKRKKNVSIVV